MWTAYERARVRDGVVRQVVEVEGGLYRSSSAYDRRRIAAAEARAARELSDCLASCANDVNLDGFTHLEAAEEMTGLAVSDPDWDSSDGLGWLLRLPTVAALLITPTAPKQPCLVAAPSSAAN